MSRVESAQTYRQRLFADLVLLHAPTASLPLYGVVYLYFKLESTLIFPIAEDTDLPRKVNITLLWESLHLLNNIWLQLKAVF